MALGSNESSVGFSPTQLKRALTLLPVTPGVDGVNTEDVDDAGDVSDDRLFEVLEFD